MSRAGGSPSWVSESGRSSMSKSSRGLRKSLAVAVGGALCSAMVPTTSKAAIIGGVNLGNLPNYLLAFTDGNVDGIVDGNWQGASKGFVGDVAVNGLTASLRTSGTVPYAGTIYTN